LKKREKVPCGKRGVRVSCPREREARIDIGCRDKVAPASIVILFHGIKRNNVPRILRFQVFWLSQYLSAMCLHYPSEMGNLLREHPEPSHIFDETTDGGDSWTGEVSFGAKAKKRWEKFSFSEIGMFFSNSSNLFENERVPHTFSFGFWDAFLFGEGVDLFSSFEEVPLPEEESASLGFWKSFKSGV
jgi:hypothetical protein